MGLHPQIILCISGEFPKLRESLAEGSCEEVVLGVGVGAASCRDLSGDSPLLRPAAGQTGFGRGQPSKRSPSPGQVQGQATGGEDRCFTTELEMLKATALD